MEEGRKARTRRGEIEGKKRKNKGGRKNERRGDEQTVIAKGKRKRERKGKITKNPRRKQARLHLRRGRGR